MKSIAELDPNFKLPETIPEGMIFHSPFDEPFKLYGLADNAKGVYCRLPESMLPICSEGVRGLSWHLAGACVRFTTDAQQMGVLWELMDTANMPHFTASGQSGMELFEETDEGTKFITNMVPAMADGHGCKRNQACGIGLPGGLRHYVLYLPLYNGIKELLLGFNPDAKLLPGRTPRYEKPVVFYGSSITQGGCAPKAGSCYTTILARRMDFAQVNLGFSGSGKGEPHMAEYIASLPMSAFVLDYDHNASTYDHLIATHEPFFQIIRQKHPTLPIVIITKPDFDSNPVVNARRREIIHKTYENAVAAGDKHVYFVDGQTLFGDTDRDLCTMEGCHPNALGFLRMADRIEPVLRQALAEME